jgi:predicted Zn-dependent peptidase
MNYKLIKDDNWNLHIINSNRFKTINIVIFFTKKFNKDDILYASLLTQNMTYTSKKYNTKNKMAKIYEDLYGAHVSSSFGITGALESFTFSLDILNPIYSDSKYLKKSLDYFAEIILNPNVENGRFNETYFNILKKDFISSIKAIKDDSRRFGGIEYAKLMYKGTASAYSTNPDVTELEKVNSKDLYEFYKKLFNGQYKIDIVVHGDIKFDINNQIKKSFKDLKGLKENNLSFEINHKYPTKVEEKIDSLPFNQSRLYVGYRLNNMNYHELNHVLRVYNTILGTMNDSILFNIVREENSLCYTIGSYYSRYNPSLTIYAGINKKNYEKTVKLIKNCVDSMKDKKVLERLFESAKKTINTYLNNYYDDLSLQINERWCKEFEEVEDIETLRENINKVTIEEVINLNNKISLAVIYLLKGDN